jgi:hypothetical protein
MKIIITEEQLFTLKSLNGVKSYIEEYLSQFENFERLNVNVDRNYQHHFVGVSDKCVMVYFEIFINGPITQTNIEDEIQFAMDMYFPRDEDEDINVMWDFYFEYV